METSTSEERLARWLEQERLRTDRLVTEYGLALVRIETRLTVIETTMGSQITPQAMAKLIVGVGLVLLALTGNMDLAKRLLGVL